MNKEKRKKWVKENQEKIRGYNRKYRKENRDKRKVWNKKYRETHKRNNNEKCRQTGWKYNIKRKYGLTPEEYNLLMDVQNGRCAVCGNEQECQRLAVDHNHITGKVRGLLCINCNRALGFLKEDTERMENLIAYVKKHNKI